MYHVAVPNRRVEATAVRRLGQQFTGFVSEAALLACVNEAQAEPVCDGEGRGGVGREHGKDWWGGAGAELLGSRSRTRG
eukprot:3498417-Prymnesium_polylepis.1